MGPRIGQRMGAQELASERGRVSLETRKGPAPKNRSLDLGDPNGI
ncbi:hypothetical protein [Galactobacter caseinivorans]|nr:hypothetical protein [Galactobacter caseinivorans]